MFLKYLSKRLCYSQIFLLFKYLKTYFQSLFLNAILMKQFSSTSLHTPKSDKTPIKKVLKFGIIIVAILVIVIFSFALVSAFKGVRTSVKNATIDLISKQV